MCTGHYILCTHMCMEVDVCICFGLCMLTGSNMWYIDLQIEGISWIRMTIMSKSDSSWNLFFCSMIECYLMMQENILK